VRVTTGRASAKVVERCSRTTFRYTDLRPRAHQVARWSLTWIYRSVPWTAAARRDDASTIQEICRHRAERNLSGIRPLNSIHRNRWKPSLHSIEEKPPGVSVLKDQRLTIRLAV
jgi:hypothetical protein